MGADLYIRKGKSSELDAWREELRKSYKRWKQLSVGVGKYFQYKEGKSGVKKKRKPQRRTCNWDCFNCVYDDCIMP